MFAGTTPPIALCPFSDVASSVWPIVHDAFPFADRLLPSLGLPTFYQWHLVRPGTKHSDVVDGIFNGNVPWGR